MNRNLVIGALALTTAVTLIGFSYGANGSPADLSATAAQAPQPDGAEVLVFAGSQEDLANVAFTLKRVGDKVLVYGGRPSGGATPVLTLRSSLAGKRIYRGASTAKKDLVYSVVQDLSRKGAALDKDYLLEPAAGRNVKAAASTVDRMAQRICRGFGCTDRIAFTWDGTSDRLWLYEGMQSSGSDNARFTFRGDVSPVLPLIPILADLD